MGNWDFEVAEKWEAIWNGILPTEDEAISGNW